MGKYKNETPINHQIIVKMFKKKGVPYLETHHIIWLSKGEEDSVHNTVALCPNCHRKMHILNNKSDRDNLTNVAANNN